MRQINLITVVKYLFFLFGLIITVEGGYEFYQQYLYSFEDFYQTSFYLQKGQKKKDMLKDIEKCGKEYHVDIFFVDGEPRGNYETRIKIYSTPKIKKELSESYWIVPGEKKSVFCGKTKISYHKFQELPQEKMEHFPNMFYMMGKKDAVLSCKAELVERYGGAIPSKEGRDSRKEFKNSYMILWLIFGICIWGINKYEVLLEQKKLFLQVSMGCSLKALLLKGICKDMVVFGMLFWVVVKCFQVRNGSFPWGMGLIYGALLCGLLDAVSQLSILKTPIRAGLSNVKNTKKLRGITIISKAVVGLFISILIANDISIVYETLDLKQMEAFYKSLKDYVFVELIMEDDNLQMDLESAFYTRYLKECDIKNMNSNITFENGKKEEDAICMNYNLKEYLVQVFPEYKKDILTGKNIVFLPEKNYISQEELDYLESNVLSFANTQDVERITYKGNRRIFEYKNGNGYGVRNNPVVLYCGEKEYKEELLIPEMYLNCTYVKNNPALFHTFEREKQCMVRSSGVWEDFTCELQKRQRGAVVVIVMAVLFLGVYILLSVLTIRLEFEVKKKELILRKIHGDSMLQRCKDILCVNFIVFFLSLFCLGAEYKFGVLYEVWTGMGILTLFLGIDIIVEMIHFAKLEKTNMQRILKSGV